MCKNNSVPFCVLNKERKNVENMIDMIKLKELHRKDISGMKFTPLMNDYSIKPYGSVWLNVFLSIFRD